MGSNVCICKNSPKIFWSVTTVPVSAQVLPELSQFLKLGFHQQSHTTETGKAVGFLDGWDLENSFLSRVATHPCIHCSKANLSISLSVSTVTLALGGHTSCIAFLPQLIPLSVSGLRMTGLSTGVGFSARD